MNADALTAVIAVVAGFLVGSIPFALLLGLAKGIDIREAGSRNPGATNLGRALGFRWFLLCFALDAAKGFIPTFIYAAVLGLTSAPGVTTAQSLLWLAVMASPVLGHMFSPWIGFKGGKGVATGLGSLLGVYPFLTIPALGAFVVFATTIAIWRYVSLSSSLAAASLPLWTWYFFEILSRGTPPDAQHRPPQAWPYLAVSIALAALIIYKHRGNLARLAAGTEPRIGQSSLPASPPENRSAGRQRPDNPPAAPSRD